MILISTSYLFSGSWCRKETCIVGDIFSKFSNNLSNENQTSKNGAKIGQRRVWDYSRFSGALSRRKIHAKYNIRWTDQAIEKMTPGMTTGPGRAKRNSSAGSLAAISSIIPTLLSTITAKKLIMVNSHLDPSSTISSLTDPPKTEEDPELKRVKWRMNSRLNRWKPKINLSSSWERSKTPATGAISSWSPTLKIQSNDLMRRSDWFVNGFETQKLQNISNHSWK